MRKLITLIAVAAVVVGIGYLLLFKGKEVGSLVDKGIEDGSGLVTQARGYGPAKTPEEALEKYKKAVKARDYENAAKYCGGPFGEQLQQAAADFKDLGKALDNFLAASNKRGINLTDKTKQLLMVVDVFPADFEVLDVKKQDDFALATISCKRIVGTVKSIVTLKPDGKEPTWKVYTTTLPSHFKLLASKCKDFARAMDKVASQVKTSEITAHDVEERLQSEFRVLLN